MSISKTFSSETSGRYASAIFEVAEEAKEFDQTEKDLRSILILYNSNKYLSDFIKNPTQNIKSQESLILKISELKISALFIPKKAIIKLRIIPGKTFIV